MGEHRQKHGFYFVGWLIKRKIKKKGVLTETRTKRQVTQHGCLPSMLGAGDKEIKIVCDEETNILYWADKA